MSSPPLQVCTAGEFLNPGATAGVADTAPTQVADVPEKEERLVSRLKLDDHIPFGSQYPRSLALPERAVFTGYNAQAENSACIEAGGELIAQLNAAQTHKMCSFLIQKARAGWQIVIGAYTFGLSDLVEQMQLAAKRGVRCFVIADRRQGLGKNTKDMLTGLKAMKASGVEVTLVSGADIQQVYGLAGRHVRPGRGIMHSKTMLVSDRIEFDNENYCIVGSTNWTISSLCNFETSVLLQLTKSAAKRYHDNMMSWPSVRLTPEVEFEAEERRRSRSRTSSPSSQC